MYRCSVCNACSRPRQKRLLWVVWRRVAGPFRPPPAFRPSHWPARQDHEARDLSQPTFRREAAAELPVCPECKGRLERGADLRWLAEEHRIRLTAPVDNRLGVTSAPDSLNLRQEN